MLPSDSNHCEREPEFRFTAPLHSKRQLTDGTTIPKRSRRASLNPRHKYSLDTIQAKSHNNHRIARTRC
jgi:hypothetical protein